MSTPEATAPTLLERPKRADARRNYEKLLTAAREAFAEGGEATSLESIAERAGVGIGTLYRNFPNRQALIEALYVDEVEEVCRTAAELEVADPWEALNSWLERVVSYVATKQVLDRRARSTTSIRMPSSSRPAALISTQRVSRCSCAPRRPASSARTSPSARSSSWSSGSPRSHPPTPLRPSTSSGWRWTGFGFSRKGRGVSDSLPGGVVHPLPADLRDTLVTSSSALEAWHDITPLARNEFICWVEDAKQQATRERRIRRTREELEEGSAAPVAGRVASTAAAVIDCLEIRFEIRRVPGEK